MFDRELSERVITTVLNLLIVGFLVSTTIRFVTYTSND